MTSPVTMPWYAKGLAFQCRGCGRCCRGAGAYVWVSAAEAEAMASSLGLTTKAFAKRYLRRSGMRIALIDGPENACVFLDRDGRCAVYASRPVQCRTFPWWPEVIRCREDWEAEQRRCPGIGQGNRLTDRRTIESALAEISAVDNGFGEH